MSLQHTLAVPRGVVAVLAGFCLLAGPSQAQQPAPRPVEAAPKLDIHFVPTPQEVVDRMLEMADVKKGDFLIDLGSGDGRIPVTAAKKYGINALGVDLDPQRIKEANENAVKNKVTDKVTFEQKNLFDQDLSKATVISMYLFPTINMKLRPSILELKPGTRIVSHAFDMAEWKADQKDSVGSRDVYFWTVPAKIDGRWTVKDGTGKDFAVTFKQQFQEISGTAAVNGRSVPLKDAKLSGANISFTVDMGEGKPMMFSGRVDGDTIHAAEASGTATGAEPAKNWSASRAS